MSRLRRRVQSILWKERVEDEVAQELDLHVEMRARELVARGMSPEDARAAAVARFGDLARVRKQCRQIARGRDRRMRLLDWWDELRQDLVFAGRQMRRAPGLTALIVAMLGLGIGANTAVFSVVNAVLLRPLPYQEPETLFRLWELTPQRDRFSVSAANYLDFVKENRTVEALGAVSFPARQFTMISDGEPVHFQGAECTPSFFEALGTRPALGRTFSPEEGEPGGTGRVMVISEHLWQTRFASDPGIVGRTLRLNDEPWTVVGVARVELGLLAGTDAWVPFVPDPEFPRGDHRLEVIGRLAPEVSLEQAQADLSRVAARLGDTYPGTNQGWDVDLLGFPELLVGPRIHQLTLVPMFAVGLMLLLASANVASLLIARGASRLREVGMRVALGAGRFRLVRQLLTESVAISLLGAVAGLLLAYWLVPALSRLYPGALPRLDEATLDGPVLLFTVVVSMTVGIMSGMVPALQLSRLSPFHVLREGSTGTPGSRPLQDGLVVAQVALAMVLLVGAGLLTNSFRRLTAVDLGFDASHVLAVPLTLPESRYPTWAPETARFYQSVMERIEAIPGVEAAGASIVDPLRGPRPANDVARVDAREQSEFVPIQWRTVTPGYFRAMSIPVLKGRAFDQRERGLSVTEGGEAVVVISARLARRLWPDGEAVGERLRWNRPGGTIVQVIGVVGDVNDIALASEMPPTLYFSHAQLAWPHMTILVRASQEPAMLAPVVRRAITEVDPLAPTTSIFPLERSVAEAAAGSRLAFQLSGAFALLALAMACFGLYGVMSYSVSRRTREMGVRVALGASARDLVGLVLRHGVWLVTAGMVIGATGALGLTRYLGSVLYETETTDPPTFLGMGLLLCMVGVLASSAPALRSARVDPVDALRSD